MSNQEQQMDINLLLEEYEKALAAMTRENIQLKTILKMRVRQEQQEAAQRHEAPPAPPAVEPELIPEDEA